MRARANKPTGINDARYLELNEFPTSGEPRGTPTADFAFLSTITPHSRWSEKLPHYTMAAMAVPVLKSLEECADFSKTVEPYIAQFYELPQRLAASGGSPHNLLALYKSANPLVSGFAFSLFLAAIFLLVSEFNRNWSQVDRMWSLLPTIYNAHFAVWTHLNELPTQRVDLVLFWSVLWSVCLLGLSLRLSRIVADRGCVQGSLDLQLLAERRLYRRL